METAAAAEIDKGGLRQPLVDDFRRCLKKPAQEPLRLFHSYAQAQRRLIYKPIFKRQRSTLSMLFFGPKNGEHLRPIIGFEMLSREEVIRRWEYNPGYGSPVSKT